MPNQPKQIKRSPPDEAAGRAKLFKDGTTTAKQKNGTNNAAAARDDRTNPTETKQNICKASVNTQCGCPGHESLRGGGLGGRALTGSETDERPEAMLLSRRIICILLPHRGAGRSSPTSTPNPSLAWRRLRRPRRPASPPPPPSRRDAASPLPAAAIWGGAARGIRPWKLREASGDVVGGEPGGRGQR